MTEMKKTNWNDTGNDAGSVQCRIQHPIRNEKTVPVNRSVKLTLIDSGFVLPSEYPRSGYLMLPSTSYLA
jgi:hypothetical protein